MQYYKQVCIYTNIIAIILIEMESNNDIVSRIRQIMNIHSLNALTLSKELGYTSSEKISRLFRVKNAKPSYDIIYDIANKFAINVDWFITGRGKIDSVLKTKVDSNPSFNNSKIEVLEKMLIEKDEKIDRLNREVGKLLQMIEGFRDLQLKRCSKDTNASDANAG
ncbi:MAG: hypothetical protein CVU12_01905 [Bacteroidetes bacterium HGW-Bacteroidetes-7]|jgi:transcriptional regulator with XRE-family HTH domain|nr:MAG: hypothetical protein CVU12_01905 [Bacteroidetes bacterium HGW-Bacteroidetes-7]